MSEQLLIDFEKKFKPAQTGDQFGKAAPTFVMLFLFSWLVSIAARAEMDLSTRALFRSYPLSGIAEVEAGYSTLLWGATGSPWYGYLRPRLIAGSIGTYNALDGALEVFPVSFLGLRAGGESIQSDTKYSAYDCDTWNCQGRFYRSYVEAQLSLGAYGFFLQARVRRDNWQQKSVMAGDFIDPTSGVVLASDGDGETVYYGIVGYKWSEQWTFLGITRYAETSNRQEYSRHPYALARFSQEKWWVAFGAGVFESSRKRGDLSVLASFQWELWPSLELR